MEKLLRRDTVSHHEEYRLLKGCQHGFRTGRSCLIQLLEYMEELENAMDAGDSVNVVYLNCQKAFESVPHNRLWGKQEALGVTGKVYDWIKSFLKDRL